MGAKNILEKVGLLKEEAKKKIFQNKLKKLEGLLGASIIHVLVSKNYVKHLDEKYALHVRVF